MNLKQRIKQHINSNRWQYFIITMIFLIGVIVGNFKVELLEGGVRNHLSMLIDNYITQGIPEGIDARTIFYNSFLSQAKTIIAIWFVGLTVIGFPLILVIVFFRGFSLGFTVGFLINEKASAGIVLSLLSILPQNIVYIPFLIIWAVIGFKFSIYIIKGRNPNMVPLGTGLISYSILMLIFLLIFLMGSFIEVYLSPWLLKLIF